MTRTHAATPRRRSLVRFTLAILAAGAVGTAAFAQALRAAPPPAGERGLSIVYSMSAKGIQAGDFTLTVKTAADAYEATAQRRMTGLVRSMVGASQDYRYAARGVVTEQGLRPTAYEHQGGKRNRLVRVAFADRSVTTTATPPMGMGDPPATDAQKLGTLDQVSAIASLILSDSAPCDRTLKVFMDGRARFDFVLRAAGRTTVNTRAYRGEALRCAVDFRPIAGFPDPQEAASLTFLFAPAGPGLYAPIRIEMPTDDAGLAVLEARSFTAR